MNGHSLLLSHHLDTDQNLCNRHATKLNRFTFPAYQPEKTGDDGTVFWKNFPAIIAQVELVHRQKCCIEIRLKPFECKLEFVATQPLLCLMTS